MTICVAVKVHDCIVFSADSASSLGAQLPNGEAVTLNVYFNGNKVFNLHKELPIAAMTCGMGNIGNCSISTLAKDLRHRLTHDDGWKLDPSNYTIREVAEKARQYLFEEVFQNLENKPPTPHAFEFWIGGNDANVTHGEIWKVSIRDGVSPEPECLAGRDDFGIHFSGQPEALNRLVVGFSQKLPSALVTMGLPADNVPGVIQGIQSFTQEPLAHPAMPIQDAIDLADFLVDTTKRFVRFQLGADTVGGETDICVVTKHEGFKWIRRKHYFRPELNPIGGSPWSNQ